MAQNKKSDPNNKLVAENRRARYDYAIEDVLECGIMLMGSEVKSLRGGSAHITESYADIENGELWLINSYISLYTQAKNFGHEERRRRKLLVSKRELAKLSQSKSRKGMTLVPLKMYFNEKGKAKLLLGVAKGKNKGDKRDTEKSRDWQRQKSRLLRDHG
ncbi:MAG: SsrA-binding protein SmpB [Rhodobacteraceae bacterium]|nr:SsrA-binding protein SmpB [Paracoccaceae bacterium]